MKTTVLGAGSWGTALAHHLKCAKKDVCLWALEKENLISIQEKQVNPEFFPNETLAKGIQTEANLEKALKGSEVVVAAVPSSAMREVAKKIKTLIADNAIVVSVAKGLEKGTLKSMSEVLKEELSNTKNIAVLSGPSFALEVVRNLPTAVVVASTNNKTTEKVTELFHFENFRVYTSEDLIGVEHGGVFKNIYALAAGVSDGLGMGHNTRAALLTRGLAEMKRLIIALGGKQETVFGLSGLGDLMLTATGDLSRNRRVGLKLGAGAKLSDVLNEIGQVAEAVTTTEKALELAKKYQVEVPIIEEVSKLLAQKTTAKESMQALLSRATGAEA